MNQETIRNIVNMAIVVQTSRTTNDVNQSQNLRDELGLDSLDLFEIGLQIETELEKHGYPFDMDKIDYAKLDTVGSLYNAVTSQVNPGSNILDTP